MSVTHFSFGFSALKLRSKIFNVISSTAPLYEGYFFTNTRYFKHNSFTVHCTFLWFTRRFRYSSDYRHLNVPLLPLFLPPNDKEFTTLFQAVYQGLGNRGLLIQQPASFRLYNGFLYRNQSHWLKKGKSTTIGRKLFPITVRIISFFFPWVAHR